MAYSILEVLFMESLFKLVAVRLCGFGLVFMLLPFSALLTACGSSPNPAAQKPVLLVVSFGTSFNESRENTIGAIEKSLAVAYPGYEVRRAFTSQIIIDKLNKRDGIKTDNVKDAMERLRKDKVKELVVQPTQVMSGFEYDDAIAEIKPYERYFSSVKYGQPLLISNTDYRELISAITAETKQYDDGNTALVFMGHGTEHEANATYSRLAQALKDTGFPRYLIGTVEARPSLEDVIAEVKALGIKRVALSPLMIVAGDHANNDMAGDEDDSWKSILEADGFEVVVNLKGLGQYEGIRRLFVRHVKEAVSL
jgi:sirohydrochlorin cobaltochelatase